MYYHAVVIWITHLVMLHASWRLMIQKRLKNNASQPIFAFEKSISDSSQQFSTSVHTRNPFRTTYQDAAPEISSKYPASAVPH